MKRPLVRLRERGDCHLGELVMPAQAGSVRVSMLGWDPLSALKRTAAAAIQIATDPRLAPFIPPQALVAAQLVRHLAKMSPAELREVATEAEDEAERKLARALLKKLSKGDEVSGPFGVITAAVKSRKKATKSGGGGRTPREQRPGSRGGIAPSQVVRSQPGDQLPPPGYQYEGQPGQYPAPPGMTPIEYAQNAAAMQMWGSSAFDQPTELTPDVQADTYFDAYEEDYRSGAENDLIEYGPPGDNPMEYGIEPNEE